MKKYLSLACLLLLFSCGHIAPGHATVTDGDARQIYTGNGATTVFSVPFRILDKAHIRVVLFTIATSAVSNLTLDSDYTVQNIGDANTQVTTTATYSSAYKLIFIRNQPTEQTTTYVANDPFPAKTHEYALDKLTMRAQQTKELLKRVPALPEYADASLTPALPLPSDGKVLYWSGATGQLANSTSSITDLDASTSSATASASAAASSASAASSSASAASASATAAAASAASLQGTSASSNTIGTGTFTFTTQSGKAFNGQFLTVASASDPTNFMFGTGVYSGTTLTFTEASLGGSGSISNWTISVAGARGATGATGATGPAGSGAGDMLKANNLSDLTSASTARTNLGLGSIATQASSGVSVTGGTITGITDLAVADGGTGASTAANARTNLGLGTAAVLDVGTSASKVVQLDGSAKLPAVDGSQLTGLAAGGTASSFSYTVAANTADLVPTTSAWTTMTLNTTGYNNITSASRSSNTVTLPAGKYIFHVDLATENINSVSGCNTMIRLRNVTDSTSVTARSVRMPLSSGLEATATGYFEIAGSKDFELQYYMNGTGTPRIGTASYGDGAENVNWATMAFVKIGS